MIVLRLKIADQVLEQRLTGVSTTLGSGPAAMLRRTDAGWPALAATLIQRDSEVRLVVPGRAGTLTLRVGDEVRLGDADIALVGLLPEGGAADASIVFGDYEEALGPPGPPAGAPSLARKGAAGFSLASATPPPREAAPAAPPRTPATPTTDPFSRRRDFDAELFAALRQTPWLLSSVLLHVLLFLLFWMSHAPESRGLPGRRALTSADVLAPGEPDALKEAEEPLAPPELPPPPTVETPTPEDVPEDAPSAADVRPIEMIAEPEEEEPDPLLGTMPTLEAASQRTARRRPAPVKAPTPTVDLREEIAEDNVHDATRKAARVVREQLGRGRGGAGDALRSLVAEDVLVVQGEFDHQERVLRELGVEFVNISPHDARVYSGEAFRRPRFVFWNCGHAAAPRRMARLAPSVRAFVERGGYLFTSDWVLGNLLTHAFPGYVDTSGPAAALPEIVIRIQPTAAGADHPLLEGVFQPGIVGRWWLEQASHDIVVRRPADVTVLIESPDLGALHARSNAMAFTFAYGRGRVLHTLGHYYQEQGNLAGAVAAQRIALNFVLQGLKGAAAPAPR